MERLILTKPQTTIQLSTIINSELDSKLQLKW